VRFDGRIYTLSAGPTKVSNIIKPYKNKSFTYRMDIFIANSKNYYSMLLYTTGSKDYNVKTRAAARKHGLLLN